MRARNIKPSFYKDDELAECSMAARLLAPGLWMMADREGRLEYRPKRIKGEIFPYDNIDILATMDELVRAKHIITYNLGDKCFIQIRKFKDHQRPHRNEANSIIQPFAEELATKVRSTCDQGTKHFALNEERGMMNEERGMPQVAIAPPPQDFSGSEEQEEALQGRPEPDEPLPLRPTASAEPPGPETPHPEYAYLCQNDRLPFARAGKGWRLTQHWELCEEWGEWAMQVAGLPREKVEVQAEKFREYFLSKNAKKPIKQDWKQAWQNWVR